MCVDLQVILKNFTTLEQFCIPLYANEITFLAAFEKSKILLDWPARLHRAIRISARDLSINLSTITSSDRYQLSYK